MDDLKKCRVRFAPSPTGYLHIGGARTALFNWLTARNNCGTFILRIEDTDKERFVDGSIEQIMESLKWLGINWDEGPDCGGEYGPYIQSQRLEIYKKHVFQLVEQGDAYYCFCSAERLDKMREEQKSKGESTQYDRHCRNLTQKQIDENLKNNIPYVIRMKTPGTGNISFNDIIREEVTIPFENVDDQVLLKSDGFPTYHLANVVDDHLMKITIVIRGEEWLMSAPKHLLLYKYFKWTPPLFAHLPLLLNADRSKLSKRQNDVSVSDYKLKGFLPDAVVNFIALLGWNPGNDKEIFKVEEIIKMFDLRKCGKSGSVFDIDKLKWMNGLYIRELKKNNIDGLANLIRNYLIDNKFIDKDYDFGKIKQIAELTGNGIDSINDVSSFTKLLFDDAVNFSGEDAKTISVSENALKIKKVLIDELDKISELDKSNVNAVFKNVQNISGIKGKELYHIIRILISGSAEGPDLAGLILFLGKKGILKRLA
ncbi:MAG TPA: glutamate--tRNA ligase [bacterium]|nr:glutamate--tRNA ligase [bacterium]HPN30702.1 glutamate--tRNA ligase [bacterium]